jgi:hypothetical protein
MRKNRVSVNIPQMVCQHLKPGSVRQGKRVIKEKFAVFQILRNIKCRENFNILKVLSSEI